MSTKKYQVRIRKAVKEGQVYMSALMKMHHWERDYSDTLLFKFIKLW